MVHSDACETGALGTMRNCRRLRCAKGMDLRKRTFQPKEASAREVASSAVAQYVAHRYAPVKGSPDLCRYAILEGCTAQL